jgi:hypothetical protein
MWDDTPSKTQERRESRCGIDGIVCACLALSMILRCSIATAFLIAPFLVAGCPEEAATNTSLDANDALARTNNTSVSESGAILEAKDGRTCTAALDSSRCPTSYPANLCTSPDFHPQPTGAASCGGFAIILSGGIPHYGICVYDSSEGGTLVGSQGITDTPEFCRGTAWVITAGQVPAGCAWAVANEFQDGGQCRDAASDDVNADGNGEETGQPDAPTGRNDSRCPMDFWSIGCSHQACSPVGLNCLYGCDDAGCAQALFCQPGDAGPDAGAGVWVCGV